MTLTDAACAVLRTAAPQEKAELSRRFAAEWRAGRLAGIGNAKPPDRPARPARPELKAPREMPRRRSGSATGRIALLHALAHIELNAIDLAWDIVARFAASELPIAFYDDWVGVADEEAKHHSLLAQRLAAFDAAYGDLPAHDGLWEAAASTAHDLPARLAVVPLVLEARGLDVTPDMIGKLGRLGDTESAAVLRIIYDDEIGHVAAGVRWFAWACTRDGLPPAETYHALVRRYYTSALKPPFNRAGRDAAGFPPAFYEALAAVSP